jgi:predicted PurR-regulated permease PerM
MHKDIACSPMSSLAIGRPAADMTTEHAPRSSVPVRVLAALAIGAVLYVAHAAFIPIALAVLFALILTTPVEALYRHGVPRSAAALLILFVMLGLLGLALNMFWTPAQKWWSSAPQTLRIIEHRVQPLARVLSRIEALSDRAGQLVEAPKTAAGVATTQAAAEAQSETGVAVEVLDRTRAALVGIVTTTILTLFLLAGGPPMLARLTASVSKDLQFKHTLALINAVRNEVSRYYASIAVINISLGVATAAAAMLLGMPNPIMWGALAAILNFIPYIGSAVTLLLLVIVAFVSFDSLGRVAAVAASYLALATIEGQVVQPLVVGRRLELNPIIVFLAVWFGGWFWGIAGIVIAVPSLVALKVVAEHSRRAEPLVEVLSPNETSRVKALSDRAGQSLRKKPDNLPA